MRPSIAARVALGRMFEREKSAPKSSSSSRPAGLPPLPSKRRASA
jgi:hypothetical protein